MYRIYRTRLTAPGVTLAAVARSRQEAESLRAELGRRHPELVYMVRESLQG